MPLPSRWLPSSLFFLCLAAMPLQAADIAADLHIDRVTVYLRGAVVTRTGTVAIPAGAHRLLVRGLPAGINRNLVTVRLEGAGVRLGGVDVETVNEGDYVAPRERELRARLELLTDQRSAIQDEVDTAQTQLKLLESLAANPTGGANGGASSGAAVNGANLNSLLASVGSSAAAARTRVREAKLRQRTVDRDVETVKAELAKVATTRKASTALRVAVESTGAATVPVAVSYRVDDAGWDWIYQARLDTVAARVDLLRQGRVRQRSGEDWNDVALTLTTAVPEANVSTPTMPAQFLDLRDRLPVPVAAPAVRALGMARAEAKAADGMEFQEVVVSGASARATAFSVDYDVPGRTSLAADNQERLLPVSSEQFKAGIVARVVPAASRRAWLEATFTYELDTPIEAGTLQLYRDGAYVGEAPTPAVLPGAEVRMPFGADERIRVALRDEAAKSDQSSALNRQVVQETRQRFEITSYHSAPIAVQVLDRVPVSRNNDVRVEVLKGATEPTRKDLDGRAGVYAWEFSAEPQKTVAIRHYYSVRYPRDRLLTRSEESD